MISDIQTYGAKGLTLAQHMDKQEFPCTDKKLQELTGWSRKDLQNALTRLVQTERAFRVNPGQQPGLFALTSKGQQYLTDQRAAADGRQAQIALAVAAITALGADMRSGPALADACGCDVDHLDSVLQPLVLARKLVRINVLRGDVAMWGYRVSSTWNPQEVDFAVCGAPLAKVHRPTIQGVSAPTPATLKPAAPGTLGPPRGRKAPSAPPAPPAAPSAPPPESLARPGEAQPAQATPLGDVAEERAAVLTAALGWKVEAPSDDDSAQTAVLCEALVPDTAPSAHEGGELVCAVNSRGELVLDLGDGDVVKLPPSKAAELRSFLQGCAFLDRFQGVAA